MGELYCVPLGQTARKLFYEKLGNCGAEGLLVLPNRILKQQAKNESGVNCSGMDWLAGQIINNSSYARFYKINRRTQELVIQKLLNEMAENNELNYFRHMIGKKNFVKEMTSLVGELARSGATEDQFENAIISLQGGSGADSEWENRNFAKDKEIAKLYSKYIEYLKDHSWFDIEGKYRLAIKVLESEKPRLPWKKVCFSEFFRPHPQQIELMKELSKHCQVAVGLMYEANRDNIFEAAKYTYEYLLGPYFDLIKYSPLKLEEGKSSKSNVLQHITNYLERDKVVAINAKDAVRLWSFNSPDEEMRWVLTDVKRLLHNGENAKDILVTVRDFANYSGLRQLADEYGIPVALPKETSLGAQPLAEFILLLLDAAMDNRQGAEAYFRILSSAIGKIVFGEDAEAADALRLKKYYTARKQLQNDCRELLKKNSEEYGKIGLVDDFLANLRGKETLKFYIGLLTELLESLKLETTLGDYYKKGHISLEALECGLLTIGQLFECLESLNRDYVNCGLENKQFTAGEVHDVISEALSEKSIILDKGRDDGVLVTEIFNVQGMSYKYVYIMGLRQGEFPRGDKAKWPYNDSERGQLCELGIDMTSTKQAFAEEEYFFAATIAQANVQLTLSWYKEESSKEDNKEESLKEDTPKDDSTEASPYIDQIMRLFSDLRIEKPGCKILASPQEFMQLGHKCDKAWLLEKLGENTLEASNADKARSDFCLYNGFLEGSPVVEDIGNTIRDTFSASGLETYAACPFCFMGEYLWRQDEFNEKTEELAPVDEGNLLHDALAIFLGRHLNKKLKADNEDLSILEKELGDAFEKACAKAGFSEENIMRNAEKNRLLSMLKQWLHYECQKDEKRENFVPVAVEWDFGQNNGPSMCMETLSGNTIKLKGRIDRIDSDGERLFIIDYKRSKAPAKKDLVQGLDLQLPVYLLAADALYTKNGKITGGGYLVLKDGKQQSVVELAEHNENDSDINSWQGFKVFSKELLSKYADAIRKGDFRAKPRKKCDDFCPMRDICRVTYGAGGEENE